MSWQGSCKVLCNKAFKDYKAPLKTEHHRLPDGVFHVSGKSYPLQAVTHLNYALSFHEGILSN